MFFMDRLKIFLLLVLCISPRSYGQSIATDSSAGRNIIYVVQFQFTENGIGFGGGYERYLSPSDNLSLFIPAMLTFDVANTSRLYDFNTGSYKTGKADAMFYTMPGLKYYPWGSHNRISYATGASFVIGAGQKSGNMLDLNGLNETEQVQSHFLTGLMWQNSVNVTLYPHLSIGLEIGIGGSLTNKVGGIDVQYEFLIQGAFKIGYRF